MAIETKYGANIEIDGIPADEPVFVIRARDALSIKAIMAYQTLAIDHNCDIKFLDDLEKVIEWFEDWQSYHLTRLPD